MQRMKQFPDGEGGERGKEREREKCAEGEVQTADPSSFFRSDVK